MNPIKNYGCEIIKVSKFNHDLLFEYNVNGKKYNRIQDFNIGQEYSYKTNSDYKIIFLKSNPQRARLIEK